MSRSGYWDDGYDCDNPVVYLWRSIVERSIGGKRGQKLLRDLAAALDALPEKRLVSGSFIRTDGEVCTLGALGIARGLDMSELEKSARDNEEDCYVDVAWAASGSFDVSRAMAAEIMHQNDEACDGRPEPETPEERWQRMRGWVSRKLADAPSEENEEHSDG